MVPATSSNVESGAARSKTVTVLSPPELHGDADTDVST